MSGSDGSVGGHDGRSDQSSCGIVLGSVHGSFLRPRVRGRIVAFDGRHKVSAIAEVATDHVHDVLLYHGQRSIPRRRHGCDAGPGFGLRTVSPHRVGRSSHAVISAENIKDVVHYGRRAMLRYRRQRRGGTPGVRGGVVDLDVVDDGAG